MKMLILGDKQKNNNNKNKKNKTKDSTLQVCGQAVWIPRRLNTCVLSKLLAYHRYAQCSLGTGAKTALSKHGENIVISPV